MNAGFQSANIIVKRVTTITQSIYFVFFSNYSMLVFGLVTRKCFKILELWLCNLDTRSIEIPQITAALTAHCQEHSQTDTRICRYRLLELHRRLCSIKMLF